MLGSAARIIMVKKHEYEFMGPTLGPIAITLVLPLVTYLLVYGCTVSDCLTLKHVPDVWQQFQSSHLASRESFAAITGWVLIQLTLHAALPGRREQGAPLRSGKRLTYKLTGMSLEACI